MRESKEGNFENTEGEEDCVVLRGLMLLWLIINSSSISLKFIQILSWHLEQSFHSVCHYMRLDGSLSIWSDDGYILFFAVFPFITKSIDLKDYIWRKSKVFSTVANETHTLHISHTHLHKNIFYRRTAASQ